MRNPNELIRKLPGKDSHGQAQQVQIYTTGPGNTLNKQIETNLGDGRIFQSCHIISLKKERDTRRTRKVEPTQREKVVNRNFWSKPRC